MTGPLSLEQLQQLQEEAKRGKPPVLVIVQASDWATKPSPPREWEIEDMIPRRQVTLLVGDGGIGKTIVALQLGLASGTETSWLGKLPRKATVLYVGAEDEMDELHRRVEAIAAAAGIDLAEAKDFHLCSLVEDAPSLATFNGRNGEMTPTAMFEGLTSKAKEMGATLIFFDASADFFDGDESSRRETRRFIALLRRMCMELNATVMLLAHPSVAGMASGRGYSGSTAWNNSVRSRLYLERLTDGENDASNLRVLSVKKANYAADGQRIVLEWHNGLYRPQTGGSTIEQAAANAAADQVFLTLLDRLVTQGRDVSPNPSRTYAPALMLKFDEAKGFRKGLLEAAMNRLLEGGKIKIVTVGPPSKARKHLVRS
jgi:RecA-family ATPase